MLLDAVNRGRLYQVKFLLETDSVNVNATDQNGQTPLMKAILLDDKMRHTRYKIVRLLLDHGAKVNIADKNGRTALMLATILGLQEIAERILKISIIDLDLNAGDLEGNTALIHAAIAGRADIASILINSMKRFGLDVDKKNNKGMTAMLEATIHGQDRTAEVLMVEGDASLTIRDPFYYMNAREWAVQNELHNLVKLITTKQQMLAARLEEEKSSSKNLDEAAARVEVSEGEPLQGDKLEATLTPEPRHDVPKRPSSNRKGDKNLTVPRAMQSLRDTSLQDPMSETESVKQVTSHQEPNKETDGELIKTSHENEAKRGSESNSVVSNRNGSASVESAKRRTPKPRIRSASSGLRLNAKSEFQRLIELYGVQNSVTYRRGYDPTTLPPSGMWPDPNAQNSLSNSYENLSIIDKDDCFNDFPLSRTSSRRSMVPEGQGRRMSVVGGMRDGRRTSIVAGAMGTDRRRKMPTGNFAGKGMFEALGRKPGDRKMSMIARPNMERPILRRTNTMSPLVN